MDDRGTLHPGDLFPDASFPECGPVKARKDPGGDGFHVCIGRVAHLCHLPEARICDAHKDKRTLCGPYPYGQGFFQGALDPCMVTEARRIEICHEGPPQTLGGNRCLVRHPCIDVPELHPQDKGHHGYGNACSYRDEADDEDAVKGSFRAHVFLKVHPCFPLFSRSHSICRETRTPMRTGG